MEPQSVSKSSSKNRVKASFPKKLKFLFDDKRYKVLYGGRGGAKSWSIARALLILGVKKRLRILCAREIQKSISDSVHQLLEDQIKKLGFEDFYEVKKTEIVGKNGTTFGFEGLKHNIQSLKSYEGADICWVEEAHTVSKSSWDILIPTIRKDMSEIWVSFNPDLEEDETYQRFVVKPPKKSFVTKIGWRDNKWFPPVLDMERKELKERDPAAYDNIWEGNPRQAVEGAIYAHELQRAAEEGRIMKVPYDETIPVNTYWDLGHSDQTAIWFIQQVGFEYRVLRYYSNSQQKMHHYIQYLQELPYNYGTVWLPHDAQAEQLGAEKTIEQQARDNFQDVRIAPKLHIADGIEAVRSLFPQCYFDKSLCADGLTSLRRYAYKKDIETGKISHLPEHTIWSHGADAFRYFAVSFKEPAASAPKQNFEPWEIG